MDEFKKMAMQSNHRTARRKLRVELRDALVEELFDGITAVLALPVCADCPKCGVAVMPNETTCPTCGAGLEKEN